MMKKTFIPHVALPHCPKQPGEPASPLDHGRSPEDLVPRRTWQGKMKVAKGTLDWLCSIMREVDLERLLDCVFWPFLLGFRSSKPCAGHQLRIPEQGSSPSPWEEGRERAKGACRATPPQTLQ